MSLTPTTVPGAVDPTNAAQAQAWDGDEGAYWADHDDRFDAALAAHQPRFQEVAAVGSADAVLDIGCGSGETTREAARAAPAGHALGIDLSARLVARARACAATAGITNARFVQGDAQVHPFPAAAFDLALSRTGSMFFGRPEVAFANIARALRPGGRLVLLTWQPAERNEWIGALAGALSGQAPPAPPSDAPGPFSLSDPGRVRALLEGAGFAEVELEDRRAPMVYGSDVDEAHGFVLGLLGWMLADQDQAARRAAEERLREVLADHVTPDGVAFGSACWLVTAIRP